MTNLKPKHCQGLKSDGTNCRAKPLGHSRFCFFHDPESFAKRKAAQRDGGHNRAREVRTLSPDTPDRTLHSEAAASDLLDDILNGVLKGELDPVIAREATRIVKVRVSLAARSSQAPDIVERLLQVRKRLAAQEQDLPGEPASS